MKNSGQFARIQHGKTKAGREVVTAYVTQDIVLKKGQTFYINDLEESLNMKVKNNIISKEEASANLDRIRESDEKFERETTSVCRALPPKEDQGN